MDDLLVGIVNRPDVPAPVAPSQLPALERHRLAPLAWRALTASGCADRWAPPVRDGLRRASAAQALVSDLLDAELRRLLTAAGDAGVRTIVIKGAALAHTHYPRPHLRPRSDSDVVIAEVERDAMSGVLCGVGYTRTDAIEGSLLTQQAQWTRTLQAGLVHALDVHWRVFNPHLFGHLLSFDHLRTRAVPVPALGPHAFAPCAVDGLLLACVHRAAHHAGEEDAIWDFDVHLLLSSLTPGEVDELAGMVAAADLRSVVAASVKSARARFGTPVPAELLSLLAADAARREPTAAFVQPGRRQVDVLSSDLAALPAWRDRLALLRQHLFPPPSYIRARYGLRSAAWLPFAYAHRIVAGVPRWFRPHAS